MMDCASLENKVVADYFAVSQLFILGDKVEFHRQVTIKEFSGKLDVIDIYVKSFK